MSLNKQFFTTYGQALRCLLAKRIGKLELFYLIIILKGLNVRVFLSLMVNLIGAHTTTQTTDLVEIPANMKIRQAFKLKDELSLV